MWAGEAQVLQRIARKKEIRVTFMVKRDLTTTKKATVAKIKLQKCYNFYEIVRNLNIKWMAHDIKQFLKLFLHVTLVRKYKGKNRLIL